MFAKFPIVFTGQKVHQHQKHGEYEEEALV